MHFPGKELFFDHEDLIVSKTDVTGKITYGHLEKCLCEIKVALLLYSGLMIFGLRSSLSV